MAIVNRSLDSSEQIKVFNCSTGAVATGATFFAIGVPYPCVIKAAQMWAVGLSGSPTWTLKVHRFIVGTGLTAFAISGANALPAMGTSGVMQSGVSLLASGNTLLNLVKDDLLFISSAGTDAAVAAGCLSVALQPIQDIKKHYTPGV